MSWASHPGAVRPTYASVLITVVWSRDRKLVALSTESQQKKKNSDKKVIPQADTNDDPTAIVIL